jgi:hypothetical protein
MRLLTYLRQNVIAIIALVIALGGGTAYAVNTVRSSDIVDGQVQSVDLGTNAVTNAKIAANAIGSGKVVDGSITGADINESTLGKVPNASKLGGIDSVHFRTGKASAVQQTDHCVQTGTYELCAPVTITVPAGTYYHVSVTANISVFSSLDGDALYCAASEGPACLNNTPSGMSTFAGRYSSGSDAAAAYFGPGTHTFGVAVRMDQAIVTTNTGRVSTLVEWNDYGAESAFG